MSSMRSVRHCLASTSRLSTILSRQDSSSQKGTSLQIQFHNDCIMRKLALVCFRLDAFPANFWSTDPCLISAIDRSGDSKTSSPTKLRIMPTICALCYLAVRTRQAFTQSARFQRFAKSRKASYLSSVASDGRPLNFSTIFNAKIRRKIRSGMCGIEKEFVLRQRSAICYFWRKCACAGHGKARRWAVRGVCSSRRVNSR